ncbi:MAG: helix-turn-helix domain-containing protein [Clostridia bacterium]|nr:helix-turn-helix domain-containing protein [Clostridia bacterium]
MKEYERLEQIRKEYGYSIKYISVLLNATPKQVRKWEKGENKMKVSKYNLSKIL